MKQDHRYFNFLQRYLIGCNKDIQAPQYLRHNRFQLAPSFDFSSILIGDAASDVYAGLQRNFQRLSLHGNSKSDFFQLHVLNCKLTNGFFLGTYRNRAPRFENVPVLDVNSWPNKEQLGLDESQYEALKIALTKEVAVIQGPPGTGKTFLGLKVRKPKELKKALRRILK